MKKILLLVLIGSVLFACTSSSKLLQKGRYDAALHKAAKKIKKNPSKFKEVDVFRDAYNMANKIDQTAVDRLRKEGDPANWDKIYALYSNMRKRQDLFQTLPPVGLNIDIVDYDEKVNSAKTNATEYAYANGVALLKKNNRFDARKAYAEFLQVKSYKSNYKDVDEKLAESKFLGTTNVYFSIEDVSNVVAPKGLIQALKQINVNELDREFLNYDAVGDTTRIYHYTILLNMKLIDVSPEETKQNAYIESKKIKDGYEYVLDENGNVKKDTAGNDIKVPKYKTITCNVKEYHQRKTARISGTIDYIDNANGQVLKSEPITSDAHFEHFYAIANGDFEALKPETLKKINVEPVPFPPDEALILQAGDVLKGMTKNIIDKNKTFLK